MEPPYKFARSLHHEWPKVVGFLNGLPNIMSAFRANKSPSMGHMGSTLWMMTTSIKESCNRSNEDSTQSRMYLRDRPRSSHLHKRYNNSNYKWMMFSLGKLTLFICLGVNVYFNGGHETTILFRLWLRVFFVMHRVSHLSRHFFISRS